jgi:hypothetical protein
MRILINLLLLVTISVCGQQQPQIEWQNETQLSWDDFKAEPDYGSATAAITASGISYSFAGTIKGDNISVTSNVSCYFHPHLSWVKMELASDNLLAHEQLHFNIAELYARKLRKRIASFNFSEELKKEMNRHYEDILVELKQFQSKYDSETDFSRNLEQQMLWQKKISTLLVEYKNYTAKN